MPYQSTRTVPPGRRYYSDGERRCMEFGIRSLSVHTKGFHHSVGRSFFVPCRRTIRPTYGVPHVVHSSHFSPVYKPSRRSTTASTVFRPRRETRWAWVWTRLRRHYRHRRRTLLRPIPGSAKLLAAAATIPVMKVHEGRRDEEGKPVATSAGGKIVQDVDGGALVARTAVGETTPRRTRPNQVFLVRRRAISGGSGDGGARRLDGTRDTGRVSLMKTGDIFRTTIRGAYDNGETYSIIAARRKVRPHGLSTTAGNALSLGLDKLTEALSPQAPGTTSTNPGLSQAPRGSDNHCRYESPRRETRRGRETGGDFDRGQNRSGRGQRSVGSADRGRRNDAVMGEDETKPGVPSAEESYLWGKWGWWSAPPGRDKGYEKGVVDDGCGGLADDQDW